ncbi:VOC family protein [Photorhabdus heterorhabditis]|uniref:Bleomycin resistance protein n=1 Tax=Photorhabdus heterorhabditis TaxID=880156 RepID=A0A5B0WMG8_9GAMM|nr:VOC family protein [Photorhabdus heterorhabditis]KAA1188270.1 bleomycin resistance protein [Photorhabdus heterorhabditis]
MINFKGLGHINIVVDDIQEAIDLYSNLFGAIPKQLFPHFKNSGFSKAAGFIDNADQVDVSIAFLEIPGTGVFIELMEYHNPTGIKRVELKEANDIGGVGHICFRVQNIDSVFEHVKNFPDVRLINSSPLYKAYKIDEITSDEFMFFNEEDEKNTDLKQETCKIIGKIRYFYFIDKYNIQWEFEEGHDDIGSN